MRVKFYATAVLAVAGSMLMAACGGGEATTTPTQASTAAPTTAGTARPTTAPLPTSAPTATMAPTATPVPVPTGALHIAIVLGTGGMIPDEGSGTGNYFSTMFDPVIGATGEGKIDPARGFATSWTSSADFKVWTIKLRDGVTFHDGGKATSADLKYQLEFAARDGSRSGKAGPLKKAIGGITTPDDSTVVVTLNAADIYWPVSYLSSIAPASVPFQLISSKYMQSAGIDAASKKAVGSGPYKFSSLTIGDRMVVDALDRHWYFGVPRTKTVTFLNIPEESTRVALLKTGGADLAPISTASVAQMKSTGLQSFVQTDTQVVTYQFREQFAETYPNYGKNPLADLKVRQALHYYAIDRQTLVDAFMNGAGAPTMNYPILSLEFAYEALPIPKFDLARAKQMLTEAGYPNGFAVDFIQFSPALFPEGADIGEALAVMFEKAGLKVSRIPMEQGTWRAQMFANVNKAYYTKPTIVGFYPIPNAISATPYALNPHTVDSPWVMNRDPVGYKLAQDWAASPNPEEYVKRGKAYHRWEYENVTTFEPLFTTGTKYGATTKIPAKWTPGKDSGSQRFEFAVAMR